MKVLVSLLIFLLALFLSFEVEAHSREGKIFKINNSYVTVYPIQYAPFEIYLDEDNDIAPENYIKGQNLQFEFEATESTELPSPINYQDVRYYWNFGDGIEVKETTVPNISYSYQREGTFVMSLEADLSKAVPNGQRIPIQSVVLHILPTKDYQLPKPIIKVNEKVIKDKGAEELDLSNKITFDASLSEAGTSKIAEYQWYFGQGSQIYKDQKTSYQYILPQYYADVVLRIKDEKGFFVDSTVMLTNNGKNEPTALNISNNKLVPIGIGIGSIALVLIISGVLYHKNKAYKKKG